MASPILSSRGGRGYGVEEEEGDEATSRPVSPTPTTTPSPPTEGGSEERKSCAAAKGKRKSHQPSFAVKGWRRRFSSKQDVAIGANAKEEGGELHPPPPSAPPPSPRWSSSSSSGKEGRRSCLWDDAKREGEGGKKESIAVWK